MDKIMRFHFILRILLVSLISCGVLSEKECVAYNAQIPSIQHYNYGKLIFDGTSYLVNDDFIRDLIRIAKSFDDPMTSLVFNDIITSLREGKTVTYNSLTNTIYNVDFKSIPPEVIATSQQINRMQWKEAQRVLKKHARKNSLLYQFNAALSNFGKIQFTGK